MRTPPAFSIIVFSFLLASCAAEQPPQPSLRVFSIVASAEPIVEGKPLPFFTENFTEGTKAIYIYAQLENVLTMSGSIPVQMTWFSPNDFLPPRNRTSIELIPPKSVAAFEIHSTEGMKAAPHMIQIHAGKNLTASGTLRFYVGMTQKDIDDLLLVEEEYKQHLEEERRKAEEEEKKRAASGATLTATGASVP